MKDVSILMPFRTFDSFMKVSLTSISRQQGVRYQIVLVGSAGITKENRLLLDAHCQSLNLNYRVFFPNVCGVASALNYGLKKIETDLTARFDADDLMVADRLIKQVNYLEANPAVLVLGGQIKLINSRGLPIFWRRIAYPVGCQKVREALTRGCFVAHPSVMMRTDSILKLGGYQEWYKSAEDYDLWLRILSIGEIDNLSDLLLLYRQHKNQESKKVTSVQEFTRAALESYSKQKNN